MLLCVPRALSPLPILTGKNKSDTVLVLLLL